MASTSTQFEWREVSSGRWERDIDEAEQFYTSLARVLESSGRMLFAITGHVTVSWKESEGSHSDRSCEKLEKALRTAWVSLRYDEPAISTRVEWNPDKNNLVKTYTTLSSSTDQAAGFDWVKDTCQIIDGYEDGKTWCNADPPAPKLPTLFIVRPGTTHSRYSSGTIRRDLVIRSPHDVMDGIGALQLLHKLLMLTSAVLKGGPEFKSPRFGNEWQNLNPPLRVALDLAPIPSSETQRLFETIVTENSQLTKDVEVLSLPYKKGEKMPGKHQRVELRVPCHTTARLITACKKAEVSITHAYHSAAIITLKRMQTKTSGDRQVRYINYALINLRRDTTASNNVWRHAAAVYHSVSPRTLAIDLRIGASSAEDNRCFSSEGQDVEWFHVLSAVKSFYASARSDSNLDSLSPLIWQNATPATDWSTLTPPDIPPPNEKPSVSISSMGIVDKIIQRRYTQLDVNDPWVTGEELGTGMGLFLGTFRDELTVSAAYNAVWHEAGDIEQFLQTCHNVVLRGLGIE